jgi:archaeal preflagellin peptidase FlaK
MFELMDFGLIRIGIAVLMLGISSVLDLWKREVHDVFWIIFGVIAGLLLLLDPSFYNTLPIIGFSLIIAPIALLAWRFGLFGGADAFALIVLAAISPLSTIYGSNITPFTTLSNAAVLFILPILLNIIRNTIALMRHENIFEGFKESRLKKVVAVCVGYKTKKPKYAFSIERSEKDGKRFSLSLHNADTAEYCTKENTWITPGIPYLILISIGYVIQIFYGDIIQNLLNNL